MIQCNFSAAPIQRPPQPPHSAAGNPNPLFHRRQQSFSSRILKHGGPARDTTINAATKAAARQKTKFTKNFTQMDEIMAEFAAELNMIEKMKKEVIVTQQHMALSSLRWYSALSIQQCYRGSRSRFALKKLRKARLILHWLRFRVHYRYRCKMARKMSSWAKHIIGLNKLYKALKYNRAVCKIQRHFRNRRKTLYLFNSIKILMTVKNTRDHCLLFGTRRAFQYFMAIKERETTQELFSGEYTYAEINRVRRCLATWIRKRRRRSIKGSQGKMAFYILSNFYNDDGPATALPSTNPIIEFIRRKTDRTIGTPKSINGDEKKRRTHLFGSRSGGRSFSRTSGASSSALGAVTGLSSKDLPIFITESVRSIFDAAHLILEMWKAAQANPVLIDDAVIPSKVILSATGSKKVKTGASTPSKSTASETKSPPGNKGSTTKGGGKGSAASNAKGNTKSPHRLTKQGSENGYVGNKGNDTIKQQAAAATSIHNTTHLMHQTLDSQLSLLSMTGRHHGRPHEIEHDVIPVHNTMQDVASPDAVKSSTENIIISTLSIVTPSVSFESPRRDMMDSLTYSDNGSFFGGTINNFSSNISFLQTPFKQLSERDQFADPSTTSSFYIADDLNVSFTEGDDDSDVSFDLPETTMHELLKGYTT